MEGEDVFVVLPQVLKNPLFPLSYRRRTAYSIIIVITPLAALMKEFKERFAPEGILEEFLGELQDYTGATERVTEEKYHFARLK